MLLSGFAATLGSRLMRLGIDLDGVVADFNTGWMRRYNEQFGTELDASMVTSWNAMLGLTRFASMQEFWGWAQGGSGGSIFRDLPAFPDAVPTLRRLADDHKIVIITTKPRWAVHDTFAWISEHGIPTQEVHMITRKWEVDCDVYLDDAPHLLPRLVSNRPEAMVVRFARPWNREVEGAHSVHSWSEFEKLVAGFT